MKSKFSISTKTAGYLIILLGGISLFTSCASMSSMQTARTTEKGEFSTVIGLGVASSNMLIPNIDTARLSFPELEVGVRYGITDKMDVGAKSSIIGTATADVKYQFLGDKKSVFAGSVGLGAGYFDYTINNLKSQNYDLMLPLYFSYHPTDWLGVYCNPKYVFRTMISPDAYSGTFNFNNSHWYGATGGIRLGKRIAFLAEYSIYGTSTNANPFSQVTCGISIGFK